MFFKIQKFYRTTVQNIWLGIHDSSNEGIFVDTDGNPITFELWNRGEPNDMIYEDAVHILYFESGEDGQGRLWNDQQLSDRFHFPCVLYPPKDKYCIRVTSSEDENLCQHYIASAGPHSYAGGEINLKHNGVTVATILRAVLK